MKSFLIGSLFISNLALAAGEVKIESFAINREGGGELKTKITLTELGKIKVETFSCSFRELSTEEQEKAVFFLKGKSYSQALAILKNEATLASDQSIQHPYIASGTWSKLVVNYSWNDFTGIHNDSTEISEPLVLMKGKLTNAIMDIEMEIRKQVKEICQ